MSCAHHSATILYANAHQISVPKIEEIKLMNANTFSVNRTNESLDLPLCRLAPDWSYTRKKVVARYSMKRIFQ